MPQARASVRKEATMRSITQPSLLASAAGLILFAAIASCTSERDSHVPRLVSQAEPQAISDQMHGDGQVGFFWLPPLVSAPTLQGTFDASQSPVVTVTPLVAGEAPIAMYTTTSGPGAETVRVDAADQNYVVNWHTDQFNLDPSIDYRVAVSVGGHTVGFIDVDVVTSRSQAKNVDTQQYVPLLDGKTLPIKWFMNACGSVVCTALDSCHVAGTCDYATGTCSNRTAAEGTACDDGNACTLTDSCQGGTCVGGNPVVCAAANACHGPGTCDPTTGACSSLPVPDGTACDDGDACTQTDSCQGGTCVGASPVVCTAADVCHVPGTCDATSGVCSNPTALDGLLGTGLTCVSSSCGAACNAEPACMSGTYVPPVVTIENPYGQSLSTYDLAQCPVEQSSPGTQNPPSSLWTSNLSATPVTCTGPSFGTLVLGASVTSVQRPPWLDVYLIGPGSAGLSGTLRSVDFQEMPTGGCSGAYGRPVYVANWSYPFAAADGTLAMQICFVGPLAGTGQCACTDVIRLSIRC
jgi:hypothetical protein